MSGELRIHGSCVARDGAGVLILGPSGMGKSDLALRLLSRGFVLIADDQVDIRDGIVSAPKALAGLLEVRGLGIARLPFHPTARLELVVALEIAVERLPRPERHGTLDVPLIRLDPTGASAPDRVALALDHALGRVMQHTGAFAA